MGYVLLTVENQVSRFLLNYIKEISALGSDSIEVVPANLRYIVVVRHGKMPI